MDLVDISKSTALVKVDLQKLVLYQQKRDGDKGGYSQRAKSDLQNTHARIGFKIVPRDGDMCTTEQAEDQSLGRAVRSTTRSTTPGSADVAAATGAARTVTTTASGDFRLHGRKQTKKREARDHGQLSRRQGPVHSREVPVDPLKIGLEEFEVNPRDDAGKFVKSVTEALSSNLKAQGRTRSAHRPWSSPPTPSEARAPFR